VSVPEPDEPLPLLAPRDGVPPVVETAEALARTVEAFAAGSGPVAVDAERASGYRYGHRAYLVQLRRAGAGTALVDPVACPDLSALDAALSGTEWVLHAASQDLPCLGEVGMRPRVLFDTELAGRLAGYARVGLGSIVESALGYALEKGHAAADWSTRPLPEPWLRYAALDVEVLVELRDALEKDLDAQGKLAWAREEFAALAETPPPASRPDPWRRTSGIHRVRRRRQLAAVKALWEERDALARELDRSPGRVLPDAAIVEAARSTARTAEDLAALSGFRGRGARRHMGRWARALRTAAALPEEELPRATTPGDGPPPARAWADRDPVAAERLTVLRAAVAALADEHTLPSENLLAPDVVRRVAWTPPEDLSAASVATVLAELGARPWQVALTGGVVARSLDRHRTKTDVAQPGSKERRPEARGRTG
jgi:ribonuclease D